MKTTTTNNDHDGDDGTNFSMMNNKNVEEYPTTRNAMTKEKYKRELKV